MLPDTRQIHPRLSLVERDRRWSALRRVMEQHNVDCVVVPRDAPIAGHGDARYLTECGTGAMGAACVFPLEGEASAILAAADDWSRSQDWVTDVRKAGPEDVRAVADRLREVRLRHRRVGIVGLGGPRSPADGSARRRTVPLPPRWERIGEGTRPAAVRDPWAPWGLVRALEAAFPAVAWVDFTRELQEIRAVKSPEEIALLARSAELVDRACDRILTVARPGARDYQVWAAAIGEACRGGSELPLGTRWGSGLRPVTATPPLFPLPSHGELQRGSIGVGHVEAVYGGYRARGIEAVAIGDCDPVIKDLYGMEAEYWQRCLTTLRTGRTMAEVAEECRRLASSLARAPGRYEHLEGKLVLEGQGLGSDIPVIADERAGEDVPGARLAQGWTFLFAPALKLEVDRRTYEASWGEVLVLDPSGPRRLGRRPPGLRFAGGG